MESQALDTGASLKTVESSATQRSKTDGFSPTRLARMHDTLLPTWTAGDCLASSRSSAGGALSTWTLSVRWPSTTPRRCGATRSFAWPR